MEIKTLDMGNDPVRLDLYYPRIDNNPSEVRIALYDVRAANDIVITYDFVRDGWSITSDCFVPGELNEESNIMHEIAFIEAYPYPPVTEKN